MAVNVNKITLNYQGQAPADVAPAMGEFTNADNLTTFQNADGCTLHLNGGYWYLLDKKGSRIAFVPAVPTQGWSHYGTAGVFGTAPLSIQAKYPDHENVKFWKDQANGCSEFWSDPQTHAYMEQKLLEAKECLTLCFAGIMKLMAVAVENGCKDKDGTPAIANKADKLP